MRTYTAANLAVAAMAHPGHTRYALAHVSFQDDGSTAATDGKRLMVVGPSGDRMQDYPGVDSDPSIEPGDGAEFLATVADVKALARAIPSRKAAGDRDILRRVALDEGATEANGRSVFMVAGPGGGSRIECPKQEGTFPKVASVLPVGEPVLRFQVGAKALAGLLAAMGKAIGQDDTVTVEAFGPNQALKITGTVTDTAQTVTGVIMTWPVD